MLLGAAAIAPPTYRSFRSTGLAAANPLDKPSAVRADTPSLLGDMESTELAEAGATLTWTLRPDAVFPLACALCLAA